jgi:ribonuclease HII
MVSPVITPKATGAATQELTPAAPPGTSYRIGADENGLGARLGPLIVTAVLARVSDAGQRVLARRPRGRLAQDLGDSKRLVSHADFSLGEAWARALTDDGCREPQALFERLSLEDRESLRRPCASHIEAQCWSDAGEAFVASSADVLRLRRHLERWRTLGVEIIAVKSASLCSQRLHTERARGQNRFTSDLHAMERLLIDLRQRAAVDVHAVCGKVGGMMDYSRYFGPLSDRLHAVLELAPERSAYRFPGLGDVHFVQDADACDPLVMLASLVGKYVRELLMARVNRFYREPQSEEPTVSGYNDPVTQAFVRATRARRRQLRIVDECFERP